MTSFVQIKERTQASYIRTTSILCSLFFIHEYSDQFEHKAREYVTSLLVIQKCDYLSPPFVIE